MNGRPKKYVRFPSLSTLDLGRLTGITVGSGTLQMSGMFVSTCPTSHRVAVQYLIPEPHLYSERLVSTAPKSSQA